MSRFGPTGAVEFRGLEHSVVELPWGVLRGALGPSDGTAGAGSNVPSALSVLRHVNLYLPFPDEIDQAFEVLERHAIRHGKLYPVALPILPFLFDMLRRRSPASERIADVIAAYAIAAPTLEEPAVERKLYAIVEDHGAEIVGWVGRLDRALGALALHVPELRGEVIAAIACAERVSPELLVALLDLDVAPGRAIASALALLDGADSSDLARMAAAAFLTKYGERTPELMTRVDAALPPSAPAALRNFVGRLWTPTVTRPVVAPKLYDATVVFAGEKLVLVRAGKRSVTLPLAASHLARGDKLRVGITVHGEPRLAFVTDPDGSTRVIDF